MAGKEGEAGNLLWFPMQPDAARHFVNKPNAVAFC
jgi:hypothetical protein